jgi:two-component system, LuxR family, response regulator FixJ
MPVSPTRASVVIVEDDASLLGALTFALRADRYEVKGYRNARLALAEGRPCDCLVIDQKLPDLDGLTLIDRLRDLGVAAPALLITTSPDERCRTRAAAAQVTIVEKPLLGGKLAAHIETAIARSTA